MRVPKSRAKHLGYFARKQHMTSSFSISRGGGNCPRLPPPPLRAPMTATFTFQIYLVSVCYGKSKLASVLDKSRFDLLGQLVLLPDFVLVSPIPEPLGDVRSKHSSVAAFPRWGGQALYLTANCVTPIVFHSFKINCHIFSVNKGYIMGGDDHTMKVYRAHEHTTS